MGSFAPPQRHPDQVRLDQVPAGEERGDLRAGVPWQVAAAWTTAGAAGNFRSSLRESQRVRQRDTLVPCPARFTVSM
jgi:hypothetical protein